MYMHGNIFLAFPVHIWLWTKNVRILLIKIWGIIPHYSGILKNNENSVGLLSPTLAK